MPTNNTKKTSQRSVKKTAENKETQQAQKEVATTKAPTVEKKAITLKLDDGVLLNVKSNVYGGLIYINPRTGDKYEWNEYGDVQQLTVGDMRAMKGTQRAFFQNQWVIIDSIADVGYDDVTQEDIYRALMIYQYYTDLLEIDGFDEIFKMTSEDEVRDIVAKMSDGCRMNLIVAANTAISDGTLDSMKTIQALEAALGCELRKQ